MIILFPEKKNKQNKGDGIFFKKKEKLNLT